MIVEGIRNLVSRPLLSALTASFLLLVLGGFALLELRVVDEVFSQQIALQRAGYLSFRVERDTDFGGQIDSRDCEALNLNQYVAAATWMGPEEEYTLSQFNGPSLRIATAGGGISDVLAAIGIPVPLDRDLLIDEESQFASSRTLVFTGSTTKPPEGRSIAKADLSSFGRSFTGTALAQNSSEAGPVEACVGVMKLDQRETGMDSIRSGFQPEDGYRASYGLDLPQEIESPLERLRNHQNRPYPELAAVGTTLWWLIYFRLRRLDMVFYALAGLNRRRLFALFETEVVLLLVPILAFALTAVELGANLSFPQDHAVASMSIVLSRSLLIAFVSSSVLLAAQIALVSAQAPQILKDG